MRISDWSSDVCSSDLNPEFPIPARPMPSSLLVEDETAIADTGLDALRAEGFEARHCLTGQEALRAAGERVHDLAILDVGLPDIGGFALCRELRRERDLPVIFLTARGAEADRVLGLELGADDYVEIGRASCRERVCQ